jgi:hypothetical protein
VRWRGGGWGREGRRGWQRGKGAEWGRGVRWGRGGKRGWGISELIEKKNKSMRKGRHKGDREKNRVSDMPTEFPAAKVSMVMMHLVIYIHKHVCI